MPRRDKAIYTRVSADEHATITARAGAAGLTVSEYLRRRALAEDDVAALRARMARMEDDLRSFAEFFSAARRSSLPSPDTVPADWEGQADYQYKSKAT